MSQIYGGHIMPIQSAFAEPIHCLWLAAEKRATLLNTDFFLLYALDNNL